VNDVFWGAIGACGLLLDEGEVDPFLVNITTGIDEKEIERLSDNITAISTATAQSVVSFIEEQLNTMIP